MNLSLIIPVYKVEEYIEECLASVCNQLVNSVEVIVINDGTPDNSMKIAVDYVQNYFQDRIGQFKFINQENLGLSGARNTGIKNATGEYLAFLDSDDILESNFFNRIFGVINNNYVDIVQYKAYRFNDELNEKMEFIMDSPISGLANLSDKSVFEYIYSSSMWFAWMRVYKKELFNMVDFQLGVFFEDAYTIPFVFYEAKKIFFINESLIGYRINKNGITSTISEKSINDLKGVTELYLNEINTNPYLGMSLIPISQYYINQSLNREGYNHAKKRWSDLKKKIYSSSFRKSDILNRGNKLFFRFGVVFLVFVKVLVKLKVKK